MDTAGELGISFCSGYGGIERGLALAGVRHRIIAHVEIEAFACANLVAKMEQGLMVPAPVWTNLKTFPLEPFRDRVDFITSGYPCQPFSCAGQRKGHEDPRHLWPFIRNAIRVIRPRWCFFENVEGHVTMGLSTVISDLEEDGYGTTWGLFTAAEVGAPHRRKRVFILANRNGIDRWTQTEKRDNDRKVGSAGEGVGDARRFGQAVGCMQTAGVEQSGEAMANASEFGRRGGSEGWAEIQCAVQWPARPGSPQYDWEEPRVVEPGLGLSVNGIAKRMGKTSSRVDELRLLGNGVCPYQAARAYSVLIERMTRS